jgi:hypothetical protein
MSPVKVMP